MALVFQWLVKIATALIVLCVLSVLLIYYLASRSLPEYTATAEVSGLQAPLEIVRDNANVPHILATTDQDAFFSLGYAHAQDRLWQMIVLRRTAQGRLSEVFGASTIETDSIMRRLDLYRLSVASVDAQTPATQTALEAYARGVNAQLAQINKGAQGRGAPELFVFNAPMAPWRPADSIAIGKLMAVQSTGHLKQEVLRARMSLALPDAARLKDILPDAPGTGVASLPEYASLIPNAPRFAQAPVPVSHPLSPFKMRGHAGASNAWAAAPTRSATGGTLLANDPHLALTAPSIWYLARMNLSTGAVIGATVPGLPVVLSGRSDALGWGVTTAYADDQDLHIEEVNPDNPDEYRSLHGFKPFDVRPSIINIKDADPITLTLRWTENGPVLPGSFENLRSITPPGHVVSVAFTALSPRDTSISAAIGVMQSRTVAQAVDAAATHIAPAQNLTLADRNTIAMKTIGALPRRDTGHQSQGRMPTLGWEKTNRWDGRMPYTSNPGFVQPMGGILGNTNNKMVERPFPGHVSFTWGDTQRVQRWQRLMQARQVHTRDSFVEAQLDTVSFTARSLLPLIGAELWFTGEAAPDGTPARKRQRALTLLASWNGDMNEHLPEPLIYSHWVRALQDRLMRDELGPMASIFTHIEPLFIERVFRNIDGASIWCDVIQSAPKESCPDMARLALDDALLEIEERYSGALESLRWGDAHQAAQDHPTLGQVPLLRYFVNIRQSTSGGDNTLNRGLSRGTGDAPFQNVNGAGYRGVYDFADPDSSVFIMSTGQSGHFLSRHYDDMAQLWRRGEYILMSLDADLARAAAVGVTTLVPEVQ
ncbi:penicillin acylase family protein [Ascidiaceihabitans sp.]|uniref:penicillin acylase family protein n=1 Tax=Ascidiaceihabitans sp. TaxID=1872644 RepID=UPI003296E463